MLNSVVCCSRKYKFVSTGRQPLSSAPIRRRSRATSFSSWTLARFFFLLSSYRRRRLLADATTLPADRPTRPAHMDGGRGKVAAATTMTTVDRGSLFRTDALLCPPSVVPHQLLLRSTGAERLSAAAAADVTVHLCRRYTFVLPTGRLPHVYIYISYVHIPYARYR